MEGSMLACIRGSYLAGRVVGGGDWFHRHDCPDHETKNHQATGTVYEITNSGFVTGNNICGVMPGMAHCIGETNSCLARTCGGVAHAAAMLIQQCDGFAGCCLKPL
jgi:hypothetical protein